METKAVTRYYVKRKGDFGSHFRQEDYSSYYYRLTKSVSGSLEYDEEVYGYAQALEHISELRQHVYNGKKIYENEEFQVVAETTITTIVDVR
jgi:hypothetical protein